MKTSWLHKTLLLFFLFGCALPEKPKQCKESSLQIQHVKVHGNAFVLCPSFMAEEMSFTLQKCNYSVSVNRKISNTSMPINDRGQHFIHQLNKEDNSTKFVLHNVTVEQSGLYTCMAKKVFPPPLVPIKDEPQTLVIVQEIQQCLPHADHTSLWVGLGVLTIYGLIITYAAISFKSRQAQVNFHQHDYVNMKHRMRRRNQGGILHPSRSWYSENPASTASANSHSNGWHVKVSQ